MLLISGPFHINCYKLTILRYKLCTKQNLYFTIVFFFNKLLFIQKISLAGQLFKMVFIQIIIRLITFIKTRQFTFNAKKWIFINWNINAHFFFHPQQTIRLSNRINILISNSIASKQHRKAAIYYLEVKER